MDDSASATIGPIGSSSSSSRPSLLDTNMGSSSSTMGPQNPSAALPPKPEKKNKKKMSKHQRFGSILPS
jgi:hypothetical protein